MKIEDIKCIVEGITYQAVAQETRECTGCVAETSDNLCNNLGKCWPDDYYKDSPAIIWKEAN